MGIVLFILAFALVLVFAPIGLIFTTIKYLLNKDIKLNEYYLDLAISLDQFGNVALQRILNLIFIKGNCYYFGNVDETISSVLGKNKIKGTLTKTGILLDKFLNKIDDNHSINSIEDLE